MQVILAIKLFLFMFKSAAVLQTTFPVPFFVPEESSAPLHLSKWLFSGNFRASASLTAALSLSNEASVLPSLMHSTL